MRRLKPLILLGFRRRLYFKSSAGIRRQLDAEPASVSLTMLVPMLAQGESASIVFFTILALCFLVEYGVSVPIDSDDVNDGDYVLENEPMFK